MITENDFLQGREMARRRSSYHNQAIKEIVFVLMAGFICAIGVICSVIYADKIDSFFHGVLKVIWL